MTAYVVLRLSEPEQFELLSRRSDLLAVVWPYESIIHGVCRIAMEKCESTKALDPVGNRAVNVLNIIYSLIRTPSEVLQIVDSIPKRLKVKFLERFCESTFTDGNIVAALASSRDMFRRLPYEGRWIEIAIWRRASLFLEDNPSFQFSIEDLLPFGLDPDPSTARAIVGVAFDKKQLTASALSQLSELFPGDHYFDL